MHVLIIDGRNALYRFAHVGKNLKAADGRDTGGVHGLLMGMLAMKRRFPDAKFVVVWDGGDINNSWRNKLFPDYKSNRRVGVTAELMVLRSSVNIQIDVVRKILDGIGVSQLEVAQLEADDMVGILSAKCMSHRWQTTVYSSDQDYLQLMPYGVGILPLATGPLVKELDIRQKWRCSSDNLLKLRAILGDHSDGIPRAVSGVGPVAAARYIDAGIDSSLPRFADLPQSARLDSERLKSYWPVIHMNWRLMRILRSCNDHELERDVALAAVAEVRRVVAELDNPVQRVRAAYDEMLAIFADLDLSVAIENRQAIWRLQVV
jgi:5'-3' exonuclease